LSNHNRNLQLSKALLESWSQGTRLFTRNAVILHCRFIMKRFLTCLIQRVIPQTR